MVGTLKTSGTTGPRDPNARGRLIAQLTAAPDLSRVEAIAAGAAPGREHLANTIWGSIRWAATLGRPTTPTLVAAFTLSHQVQRTGPLDQKTGRFPKLNETQPAPFTWDGTWPGGLAVNFFCEGATRVPPSATNAAGVENPNTLTVDIAPGAAWPSRSPAAPRGALFLIPDTASFAMDEGDIRILTFVLRATPGGRSP